MLIYGNRHLYTLARTEVSVRRVVPSSRKAKCPRGKERERKRGGSVLSLSPSLFTSTYNARGDTSSSTFSFSYLTRARSSLIWPPIIEITEGDTARGKLDRRHRIPSPYGRAIPILVYASQRRQLA